MALSYSAILPRLSSAALRSVSLTSASGGGVEVGVGVGVGVSSARDCREKSIHWHFQVNSSICKDLDITGEKNNSCMHLGSTVEYVSSAHPLFSVNFLQGVRLRM